MPKLAEIFVELELKNKRFKRELAEVKRDIAALKKDAATVFEP